MKPGIPAMGQKSDMKFRDSGRRFYGPDWIARVDKAASNWENGRAVGGDYVDGLLTQYSETPTRVSIF